MACTLFGAKSLSEPILAYGFIDIWANQTIYH